MLIKDDSFSSTRGAFKVDFLSICQIDIRSSIVFIQIQMEPITRKMKDELHLKMERDLATVSQTTTELKEVTEGIHLTTTELKEQVKSIKEALAEQSIEKGES